MFFFILNFITSRIYIFYFKILYSSKNILTCIFKLITLLLLLKFQWNRRIAQKEIDVPAGGLINIAYIITFLFAFPYVYRRTIDFY